MSKPRKINESEIRSIRCVAMILNQNYKNICNADTNRQIAQKRQERILKSIKS
jgi:hypothetical protein